MSPTICRLLFEFVISSLTDLISVIIYSVMLRYILMLTSSSVVGRDGFIVFGFTGQVQLDPSNPLRWAGNRPGYSAHPAYQLLTRGKFITGQRRCRYRAWSWPINIVPISQIAISEGFGFRADIKPRKLPRRLKSFICARLAEILSRIHEEELAYEELE